MALSLGSRLLGHSKHKQMVFGSFLAFLLAPF